MQSIILIGVLSEVEKNQVGPVLGGVYQKGIAATFIFYEAQGIDGRHNIAFKIRAQLMVHHGIKLALHKFENTFKPLHRINITGIYLVQLRVQIIAQLYLFDRVKIWLLQLALYRVNQFEINLSGIGADHRISQVDPAIFYSVKKINAFLFQVNNVFGLRFVGLKRIRRGKDRLKTGYEQQRQEARNQFLLEARFICKH